MRPLLDHLPTMPPSLAARCAAAVDNAHNGTTIRAPGGPCKGQARSCDPACYGLRHRHGNEEDSDAKISWSPRDRSLAGNGFDPGLSAETPGDQSDEIWEYRQDGFPASAACPLLFLCPVRRRVRLAQHRRASIFPLRGRGMDRSAVLPRRPLVVIMEPDVLQTELPDRHRYRSCRQAHRGRRFCL